jgi:hypothetical protein
VRRADHHRAHPGRVEGVLGLQAVQRRDDAGGDIPGRGRLDRGQHPVGPVGVDQDRVRVGATDVNADAHVSPVLRGISLAS